MKGKDEFNIVSEIAIVKWGQSYNAHLSRKARHWSNFKDSHELAQNKNMPYIGKFKRISNWMLGTIDSVIINTLLKFGIYTKTVIGKQQKYTDWT